MNYDTLAAYANISLYSAMAVLTLSMLSYAGYLAGALPQRDRRHPETGVDAPTVAGSPVREYVGAGARGRTGTVGAPGEVISVPGASGVNSGGPNATPPEVGPRARKSGGAAGGFAWLATALIGVSVVLRGAAVHRMPLGNLFEFATMSSFFVMLGFCVWGTRRDLRWLGIFVVSPVLLTLGMAITVWYTAAGDLVPSLKSYWLIIHVTVATISVAIFTLAAVVSALYLVADRYERAGTRAGLARLLPPAKELEGVSYAMLVVAFPLWTFTLIAGAIWARQAWASYWNWDPKEVWTFIIWVVYAAYLHARVTTGISRQRTAWISLAGFACIVANYAIVNMYFVGQHSYSGL